MTQAASAALSSQPVVRLFNPDADGGDAGGRPEDVELLTFLLEVVARENPDLAGGSKASLEDYVTQVRNLQRYCDDVRKQAGLGPRPVLYSDVSKATLAAAMKWLLDRGRSVRTCNKLRRTILAIYNFGRNEKDFDVPPLRLKKFREPKRQPQCWSPAQVLQILRAARAMSGRIGGVQAGAWHLAHMLFLLNTGARISAAMATPTAGLDLDEGWVLIPAEVQKDKEDVLIDLAPMTVAALRAIEPQRNTRIFDDWPYDRTQRQWPALNLALKKILVAAGLRPSIDEVTRTDLHHKLRRCFVTFVTAREGRQAAKELVGHSHASTTDDYIDARYSGDRPSARKALAHLDAARQGMLFDS